MRRVPISFTEQRSIAQLCLISACAVLGCADEKPGDSPSVTPDEPMQCTGTFDTYEPGMSKLAMPGALGVELSEAEPAPPAVRHNVWWLTLTSSTDEPLLGAELEVTPHMPAHQHASPEVVVVEQGQGTYQLSPIELIMPGLWEIAVDVGTPEAGASRALFRFCLSGN